MMTVSKLRLVEKKRLPCEPATGWLGVDSRRRLFAEERACRRASLTQSARSGRRLRREESDGCQDDPESDEGANCAAESGGRGQAVRVGRSGHVPGRAIEGRGARPVGRAVRTAGRPLRVGPAGRSGGGLHGRAGLREAVGAATGGRAENPIRRACGATPLLLSMIGKRRGG